MADGRRILPADEFADYERWVNQLAPEVFKAREAVLVAKKKAQQAAERRANREVATVLTINDPSPKLEIPTGVVGPDRVAASRRAW